MEIASNVSSTPRLTTPSLRSNTPRLGPKRYEGHCKKLDFFRHASHRLSVFNQKSNFGKWVNLFLPRKPLQFAACTDPLSTRLDTMNLDPHYAYELFLTLLHGDLNHVCGFNVGCFNHNAASLVCLISSVTLDYPLHFQIKSTSVGDLHRCRSNLESLFCYDKSIPEEIIEKPVGLSMGERNIGENPRCEECHANGAVLCATCSGSGLYIDSILESQGILVKVRCLGENHTSHYLCEGMPFSSHVYYQCYFCDLFVSFSTFSFIRSYYSISQSFLIFSLFFTPATIGRRRR